MRRRVFHLCDHILQLCDGACLLSRFVGILSETMLVFLLLISQSLELLSQICLVSLQ